MELTQKDLQAADLFFLDGFKSGVGDWAEKVSGEIAELKKESAAGQ